MKPRVAAAKPQAARGFVFQAASTMSTCDQSDTKEERVRNKDHIKERAHLKYMENRAKNIADALKRYHRTKLEVAPRRYAYKRAKSENIRRLLLASMGGQCSCCGFTDWRALQVDHINGGGKQESSGRNAVTWYEELTDNPEPDKYQLLCANCNAVKKLEAKEFGHDRVKPHARTEYAEHRRALARKNHAAIRTHLLNLMGGQCCQCSFSDHRALQVDHVQGGGAADRKAKNPVNFYRSVIKSPDPERFQLLCANCNTIKRHENREHRKSALLATPT